MRRRLSPRARRPGANPAKPTCNRSGENAMAINLASVVTQFLTPEAIAQIASFLGIAAIALVT